MFLWAFRFALTVIAWFGLRDGRAEEERGVVPSSAALEENVLRQCVGICRALHTSEVWVGASRCVCADVLVRLREVEKAREDQEFRSRCAALSKEVQHENREDDECKDHHAFCQDWAMLGECLANAGYMSQNCPKACDACNATVALKSGQRNRTAESCPNTNSSKCQVSRAPQQASSMCMRQLIIARRVQRGLRVQLSAANAVESSSRAHFCKRQVSCAPNQPQSMCLRQLRVAQRVQRSLQIQLTAATAIEAGVNGCDCKRQSSRALKEIPSMLVHHTRVSLRVQRGLRLKLEVATQQSRLLEEELIHAREAAKVASLRASRAMRRMREQFVRTRRALKSAHAIRGKDCNALGSTPDSRSLDAVMDWIRWALLALFIVLCRFYTDLREFVHTISQQGAGIFRRVRARPGVSSRSCARHPFAKESIAESESLAPVGQDALLELVDLSPDDSGSIDACGSVADASESFLPKEQRAASSENDLGRGSKELGASAMYVWAGQPMTVNLRRSRQPLVQRTADSVDARKKTSEFSATEAHQRL